MPRYKLTIEYDGTPFAGWQIQNNGRSVQGVIEQAIQRFCGEQVTACGAGRTDAGVHALGQVAHITLHKDWPAKTVRDALNQHLKPNPVAIVSTEPVGQDFDARFSAIKRHYRYRIINRHAPLSLERNRAWRVPVALDHTVMHEAAQCLVGKHDFTSFRATCCQAKSPVKTLDQVTVSRQGNEIVIDVSARSFLHNQVRSIVGTLKNVGAGSWSKEQLKQALEARDRAACAAVAPACGLYLVKVDYED